MTLVRSISSLVLGLLLTTLLVNSSSVRRVKSHVRQTARLPNNETIEISLEEENLEEVWDDDSTFDFNFFGRNYDDNDLEPPEPEPSTVSLPSFNVTLVDPWTNRNSGDDYNYKDERISVSVWDCNSPGATIKSCSINGCTQDPCVVRKGSTITLAVTFVAKKSAANMWCGIMVKKGIIKRNFSCPQNDMCNARGMRCPLRPGTQYTLLVSKGISPKIPAWTWYVEGKLWDNYGTLICIAAHAKVVR